MRVLRLVGRTIAQGDIVVEIAIFRGDQAGEETFYVFVQAGFVFIDYDGGGGVLGGYCYEAILDV